MPTLEGQGRYIEGALRLLQFVEARRPTGRRFGADADARWNSFRGDLRTVDRIELMIRDADAEWPGAFGARTVYALRAVAEDEPFGAQWPAVDPVEAEDLWRALRKNPAPATPAEALRAVAAVWSQPLAAHKVPAIAATDRLVIAGPSAIAAAIEAFAAGTALDWAEQVTVIATPQAHRQLAAAATAILNGTRPARILAATDESPAAIAGARLLVSPDAAPADRDLAATLVPGPARA